MEDEMFVPQPIVIPTAVEEPLSTSPTGPSHLSNQLETMNFDRCVPFCQSTNQLSNKPNQSSINLPINQISQLVNQLTQGPMDRRTDRRTDQLTNQSIEWL